MTPGTVAARSTYPAFLVLAGRRCVVFGGGGTTLAEKVGGLLAAGARVRLVAPVLAPSVARDAARGRIVHVLRSFRPGDLERTFLAVAERDAPALDAIEAEARRLEVPLNVVDDPRRCSFILPSIVRRGDLAVAVSTGGKAPALAVRLRQELERRLGDHHARFLELAGALRAPLAERVPEFGERRRIWYRLVDSDVLDLLAAGEEEAAAARIAEIAGVPACAGRLAVGTGAARVPEASPVSAAAMPANGAAVREAEP